MKVINKFKGLCLSCMEEHEISVVKVEEIGFYQNHPVKFIAQYHYCKNSDQLYETEDQIANNYIAMKDAYNEKQSC